MAAVKKRTIGSKTYYYLGHSIRKGKKVETRQIYLGDEIPPNLDEVKRNFLNEIYKERWYSKIDKIRDGFSKDWRLMPKSAREKEIQTFMVKFTYDTQRIEGSTLTRRETSDLLERGITPRNKPVRDAKEAEAHRDLFYHMLDFRKDLSLQTVLDWHWRLFRQTKEDIAGKIRRHQVAISDSKFVPPSPPELQPLLMEFFRWYERNKGKLHPAELAALVHLKFVTIHPFSDGNGRISRIMMNFVLNKKGYPMMNIQYAGRGSYYNALERSQTKKADSIFLQWFLKRYVKDHKRFATK